MTGTMLGLGERAPLFTAAGPGGATLGLDELAGGGGVLCFFGSAADPAGRKVVDDLMRFGAGFDGVRWRLLAVSIDADDSRLGRVQDAGPGVRFLWDFDLEISRRFGVASAEGYQRSAIVLDRRLRVLAVLPFDDDLDSYAARLLRVLAALPDPAGPAELSPPPVLLVPRVFEPGLCAALVEAYERDNRPASAVVELDGLAVDLVDHDACVRRDHRLVDANLLGAALQRFERRLLPEVERAFAARPAGVGRHVVACYDAAEGGRWAAHRDWVDPAAPARFAVSVSLNQGFEGGGVCFPEYGPIAYTPPLGGALVYSTALLHEVRPVTTGRRLAYVPQLCDAPAGGLPAAALRSPAPAHV
ncbi:MAG: redoxin domain-containing protein [Acidimicrobiales bacterium]